MWSTGEEKGMGLGLFSEEVSLGEIMGTDESTQSAEEKPERRAREER